MRIHGIMYIIHMYDCTGQVNERAIGTPGTFRMLCYGQNASKRAQVDGGNFLLLLFLCFSPCRNGTRLASQITLRLHRNRIAWCRWLCVIFLHLCFVSWLFAGSLHWIMYECTAHTHRWANVWHSECRQNPFLSITISVSMCNKQQQQQKHSTQRWILVFVSKSSYIRSHITCQSTFFSSKQQISK